MKNAILALGAASLLSVLGAGSAAADPMTMMQGYSSCNSGYAQCLQASDMTIAATPTEGAEKIKMNMTHASECAATLRACYSSVK